MIAVDATPSLSILALVLLRDVTEVVMRYIAAWILGVPVSLIALWFVVSHVGCGH